MFSLLSLGYEAYKSRGVGCVIKDDVVRENLPVRKKRKLEDLEAYLKNIKK